MKTSKSKFLKIGATAALALACSAGAYTAVASPSPAPVGVISEDNSHPECYDTAKMNDPNDFCYKTIGPWNSTLLTKDEVRAQISLESMIEADFPEDRIKELYPEYVPAK